MRAFIEDFIEDVIEDFIEACIDTCKGARINDSRFKIPCELHVNFRCDVAQIGFPSAMTVAMAT